MPRVSFSFEGEVLLTGFTRSVKKVQNGFPKSVYLVLLLYFFSKLILDIKYVHNPVPQGRNSCEVDVASVIRQRLGQFIEDTQSVLPR